MRVSTASAALAATVVATMAATLAPATLAAAQPPRHQAVVAAAASASAEEVQAAVSGAKLDVARALALSLRDQTWAARVRAALDAAAQRNTAGQRNTAWQGNTAAQRNTAARAGAGVDALTLFRDTNSPAVARLRAVVARANATILAAKGLPAETGSIVEVSLAGARTAHTPITLVAADTSDDGASGVPAFDPTGVQHWLDASTAPAQAVAVVGLDESAILTAGLVVLHRELAARHIGTSTSTTSANATTNATNANATSANAAPAANGVTAAATDGYWTTRVMSVRLSDDEEPWTKGAAEIYTIVSGVGTDGQPRVDIVQMPYLDYDDTDYYPGQILVDWSHYKYNAVDAVMMEEDDSTNYSALAQALATALITVLGGVQYAPMVDAILAAIPQSWWTDDSDYVESWYVLTQQTADLRTGARGNGRIQFAQYWVSAL